MKFWKDLWKDESGAIATEYVILIGLVAIALIATLIAFRGAITDEFNRFVGNLTGKKGTATETESGIGE